MATHFSIKMGAIFLVMRMKSLCDSMEEKVEVMPEWFGDVLWKKTHSGVKAVMDVFDFIAICSAVLLVLDVCWRGQGMEQAFELLAISALLLASAMLSVCTSSVHLRIMGKAVFEFSRSNSCPAFWAALATNFGTKCLATIGMCVLRGGPGVLPWMVLTGGVAGTCLKYYEVCHVSWCFADQSECGCNGRGERDDNLSDVVEDGEDGSLIRPGPGHFYSTAFGPRMGRLATLFFALSSCACAIDSSVFPKVSQSFGRLTFGLLEPDLRCALLILLVVFLPVHGGVRAVGNCCQVLHVDLLLPAMCWVGVCALARYGERFPATLGSLWIGFTRPEVLGYSQFDVILQGSRAGLCAAAVGTGHTSLIYGRKTPKVLALADVWARVLACSFVAFLIILAGQVPVDCRQHFPPRFDSGAKVVEATLVLFLEGHGFRAMEGIVLSLIRFVMNFCHLLGAMLNGALAISLFEDELGLPRLDAVLGLVACAVYWQGAQKRAESVAQALSLCGSLLSLLSAVAFAFHALWHLRDPHLRRAARAGSPSAVACAGAASAAAPASAGDSRGASSAGGGLGRPGGSRCGGGGRGGGAAAAGVGSAPKGQDKRR